MYTLLALAAAGLGCSTLSHPSDPADSDAPTTADGGATDGVLDGTTPAGDPDPEDTAPPGDPAGEGVFSEGCPPAGQAIARRIGVDASLPGHVAVGTRGDYLLANDRAAFVITEPDKGSTYYYYGGVVADAAGMDPSDPAGCTPGEDKLDEVGLVLGELNLTELEQSVLRGFRGTSAEVLADGADGGPAIVRVRGTDDTHWLVEYELFKRAAGGGGREFSQPLGLEITLDYVLEPDSPVLRLEMSFANVGDVDRTLLSGALLSFGETLELYAYATGSLELPGLSLDYGMPWLVATDAEGALAWAVEQGNLGYTRISGVDVALDLDQALTEPIDIAPGESQTRVMFLSAGPGDGPSATEGLAAVNPEPLPEARYTLGRVSGVVMEPTGRPVPGAWVALEADAGGGWGVLDMAAADADGAFELPVPDFEQPWSYRLVAGGPGRDDSPPVTVEPGDSGLVLVPSGAGVLALEIVDGEGAPGPARLTLERSDGARFDRWLVGSRDEPLPPGEYQVTATRGYEFAPVYTTVTIEDRQTTPLSLRLERVVDSAGYLSVDTHVHSSESPDSRVTPAGQLLRAAAHGLEVVVHTEHEHIVDQAPLPADAGLADWVNNLGGEEVTASIPEHLTMFPAEPDGSPRGGIVEWYGKDLAQIYAEMRERSGGGINLMNHPGYLDTIGWDRLVAEPTLDDPTLLGLAPDAALWSWDLDGLEVMNGHGSPFADGNRRFDNWQSMLNAGHPLIAVGCSDDHGGDKTGFPRTYFASPTDDPAAFDVADLVDAFREGRAFASAGAFARVSAEGAGGAAGLGGLVQAEGEVLLDVHLEAIPEIDITHFVVFSACDEVLAVAADDPYGVVKFSGVVPVPIDGDTHLTLAAFGRDALPAGMPQYDATRTPRVLTNPVYVDGDGDGVFSAPGGRECSYVLSEP